MGAASWVMLYHFINFIKGSEINMILVSIISFFIGGFVGLMLMALVSANRITEQIKINNELKHKIEEQEGGDRNE